MRKSVQFLLLFLMCISASWSGRRTLPSGPSCLIWETMIPNIGVFGFGDCCRQFVGRCGGQTRQQFGETCPIRFPLCREEVPITVKIGRSRLSLLRVVTVKHMATRLWYSIKDGKFDLYVRGGSRSMECNAI